MVIQKPEEQSKVKKLEQRVADLEHALADAQLDRLMLRSCLEVAEEQYGFNVKKTKEQLLSTKPKRRPKRKG